MKSKVAVIPCGKYTDEKVYNAIIKGVELLGGIDKFVRPEEKILLKPNMLNRADADKAVTTHPIVFGSVARLLRESGYENLFYGDSPGHPGSVDKTAEVCGIKAVAEKYDILLSDFTRGETVEFVHGGTTRKFEICQGVLEADAIINICKMKTHQLERITGGVKNTFGCVQGMNKQLSHAKYPDAESFAKMIVDLNLLIKPRLHIMDGIIAMEGNGPASGKPKAMGVIIISDDPVAMDAVFCRLIGLKPQYVPTIYYGGAFGLGNWREEDIEILGVKRLTEYVNPDFEVSRDKAMIGKWSFLDKFQALTRRPVILEDKCIRCGDCVEACPLEDKALTFSKIKTDGKMDVPQYDYKRCIRCYCCQEMCPKEAILVKRKLL